MKIQLAYPYTDGEGNQHDPDDVVELPDVEARRLLRDGSARLPKEDAEATPSADPGSEDSGADGAGAGSDGAAPPEKPRRGGAQNKGE